MKYFYLYKITNLIDSKVYIGQSVNPAGRWRRHKSDARLGKNKKHLARAMRKYGIHNFSFEIIAGAKTLEDIDWAEITCIKQFKSYDKRYGYNIALGGNGKRIISEETRKKLSRLNTGKKASRETIKRMSRSMLGKNKGTNNGMFGKRPGHAKLTQKQADLIRKEYADGILNSPQLAQKYGVSKKTILNILHNLIYKG